MCQFVTSFAISINKRFMKKKKWERILFCLQVRVNLALRIFLEPVLFLEFRNDLGSKLQRFCFYENISLPNFPKR